MSALFSPVFIGADALFDSDVFGATAIEPTTGTITIIGYAPTVVQAVVAGLGELRLAAVRTRTTNRD